MSTRPNSRSTVANTRSMWSVRAGYVAGDRQRLAAELADVVRRRLDARLIAVKQNEVGAGLGQRDRHGTAHSLSASGNNGGPAGQIKQVRHGSRELDQVESSLFAGNIGPS